MRYGVTVPPFADLADPRELARLAAVAESAGWDGFFVWDHVVRSDDAMPVSDPWVVLAAIACATSRIRIGALVTPLARRRPWVVARQAVTLDHLSGGRLVFGAGLGNDNGRELSAFGERTDPAARARLLDASLDVLTGLWSGERVWYDAEGLRVDGVRFLPRPVQSPRIPIWVGFQWPRRTPWRRAARYDGAFPVGEPLRPGGVRELAAYVAQRRTADRPFDIVVQGRGGGYVDGTPADRPALADAGATWWLEVFEPADSRERVEAALAAGPPADGAGEALR